MVKIFQIDANRDKNNVKFMPYSFLKKFDFSIYNEVWCGTVPRKWKTLEGIYTTFNLYHPDDYRGHSLSVSDIVQIVETDTEDNTEECGFYYCDSFGWKKLEL
jgi:hypothetical protein